MVTIQEFVVEQLRDRHYSEVTNLLGVSVQMLSAYKKPGYNASLEVAKRVYKETKVVLHPFAEESLIKELEDGN